ncbi:ATP-binding protein [Cohnella hashimotonis]|uniref:histidine kinase n=1 Tax=Cohnella hashimotonis TaxID=2826895 RepID=A0ABT6THL8_9BACL|nr:ATP-binding protein [Cohnella hashimotonis]
MKRGYSANILVVVEHPAHLLAIEAALDGEPYRFVHARSGTAALRCLLREEIDVVLTDVQTYVLTYGMKRCETAGKMKSYRRFKQIPVIFMSGTGADDGDVAPDCPADDIAYLMKPIFPDVLKAKVRDFVSLHDARKKTRLRELERMNRQLSRINGQLVKAEARARVMTDTSLDAMLVLDASGVILESNPAVARLTGYDKEELKGLNVSLLLPSAVDGREPWAPPFGQLSEMETRRKNGTSFPGEVQWGIAVDSSGLLACAVRDITSRKEAERALIEAKEAAERSSQARMEFLTYMSHEVRTPLNGVIGVLDLLRESGLTPEQAELAGLMAKNGNTLMQIVNDVLDLSRIEAGRMELEQELFLLEDCLDQVGELFAAQLREKRLAYTVAVEPGVPALLRGDRSRLQQILINLIGNAVKFTEQGGIGIQVGLLEETDDRLTLEFAVKDSGIGIPADEIDRLFLPFSQASASTPRKYGGSGLGLAISKTLCELMEGSIRVEPSGDPGTVFVFSVRVGKHDAKFL